MRKYIDIFSKINLKRLIYLVINIFVVAFCYNNAAAQQLSAKYLNYIEKYKDIAVKHQQAYGIPASITLAQGLLESQAGDSPLASSGNNHFGIKCHKDWTGDTLRHDDDALQECFRKYQRAEDSFEDHARFLKRKRYQPLFALSTTDYQGWARTLKQCGYATDPGYPDKLISIIERYELFHYDSGQPIVTKRKELKGDESMEHEIDISILDEVSMLHNIRQKGGLHYVMAHNGDTYDSIAKEFGLKTRKLLSFNDLKTPKSLKSGDIIYLQEKEDKAVTGGDKYRVKRGETLYSISQTYGIKLKALLNLNSLSFDSKVAPGDTLKMK